MTPDGAVAAAGGRARPSWRTGAALATEATVARPDAWPVGLVGLLVRGALVALVLPIVVLPTMTGLATALGPIVIAVALGQADPGVARAIALTAVAIAAWLVASVLLGAVTDTVLIRWIALELDGPLRRPDDPEPRRGSATVVRVALVRSVASLPLLIVAAWGFARLVEVTRQELILPGDLAVPLVVRVVAGAPDVVVAMVAAWLVGEVVGELAARQVVLDGSSASRALAGAVVTAVRDLPGVIATLLLGTAGLIVLVVPPVAAATVAWGGLRGLLLGDGPALAAVGGALVLSLTWIGGLVLAALAATWRSALWTAEALRRRAVQPTEAAGVPASAPAASIVP